jgi:NDP-sugar pyrophosphorylase family protein
MIDARAVVAPEAKIAPDVEIGPFSVIGRDVEIGPGTWIGPHVVIKGPTRMGANNKVYQFASIGEDPQDKKYKGEVTRLEIGDRNVFREAVTVNRGTVTGSGVTTSSWPTRTSHTIVASAIKSFSRIARLWAATWTSAIGPFSEVSLPRINLRASARTPSSLTTPW